MASPPALAVRHVNHPSFNWVFLGFMILSAFLTLFFLFYFNRAFAQVISIVLRLYLKWSGNPRYIDIQSIQISPLAGRIFFGRVIYHGPNETIRVVSGHVTWRYWLRRVRHVRGAPPELRAEEDGADKIEELPCRMLLDLKGVEWFVYNRSAVYDGILDRVFGGDDAAESHQSSSYPTNGKYAANDKVVSDEYAREHANVDDDRQTQKTGSTTLAPGSSHRPSSAAFKAPNFNDVVDQSWYLQMLPIQVECLRGSLVLGNNTTPNLLVGHFERATGMIDAKKSASIDQYQQLFDFTLTQPVISLKPNAEYKATLLALGHGQQTPDPSLNGTKTKSSTGLRRVLRIFALSKRSSDTSVNRLNPGLQNTSNQWMGLSRYRANTDNTNPKLSEQKEYAEINEIVTCEQMNFLMYWDVVGKVPPQPDVPNHPNINGPLHPPPEWGIRLAFRNSHVNYGPWADRQRIHLQNMFFPRVYRASAPAERLHAGQDRVYTEMKLAIDFEGDTSLRIPIREPSKDWKYRQPLEHGQVRPPGWLDIKMANESTLTYNMAMVPSPDGWAGAMSLNMRKPVVTSSVNNKVLWKAESQTLDCDLSSPLKWCEDTHWIFNNVSTGMEMFLLREHVILLTDLATDWTSGPPSEYHTFTPMIYELNLIIKDSEFFFNVNDQNIINNASSLEDNTFIVLRHMGGENGHLFAQVLMDFREFHPRSSMVEFCVETVERLPGGRSVELAVNTPPWNTWNGSLTETTLGKVRRVSLKGSYDFNAGTSPTLVDTLSLDLDGEGLELILHGFLIRYFLIIRANYFGEHMHFKTLEEWGHSKRHHDHALPEQQPEYTKSNDIDVELNIGARDIAILLPEHIDGSGERVKLGLADLGVDLRFTNYYMDLQVDLSPITAFLSGTSPHTPQVFVDGLKLYGHRLFGLPPTEPTYICNWDFDIGSITGECSLEFVHSLLSAAKAFVFGFKDSENALPEPFIAVIHDVTLLRLVVEDVRVWIRSTSASAMRLETGEISLTLNDLADLIHSERIVVSVPGLNIAVMDPKESGPNATKAYLDTDVTATIFGKAKDAMKKRNEQQEHIRASDNRTTRSPFFVAPEMENSEKEDDLPPSIPVPAMPPPLRGNMSFKHGKIAPQNKNSRSTLMSSGKSIRSFLVGTGVSNSVGSKDGSIIHHYPSSSHAPSFYSAVESMSEVSLSRPQTKRAPSTSYSLHSLTPTSAGSKSSRHDITPPAKRNGLFEMTSMPVEVKPPRTYIKPRFPLDDLKPDFSKVPSLESLAVVAPPRPVNEDQEDDNEEELFTGDDAARTSFVIEFTPGIRAYCSTTALGEAASMLDCATPKTPDDILDMIQHGVIAKLEKLVKAVPKASKIQEFCVKLPQLNLCFQHEPKGAMMKRPKWKDVVTLQMVNLVAAVRVKSIVDDPILGTTGPAKKAKKVMSAHVMLESIHSSIKDASLSRPGYESRPAVAAASFGAEDILFWGSTVQSSTASLNIRTIAASAQSVQAPFLQDATERLVAFIDNFTTSLSQTFNTNTRRIQQFIPDLAAAGEQLHIHDPGSITRPSYVLRTAQSHIRLKDSWKIQARLRHIWHQLSPATRNEWITRYRHPVAQPVAPTPARDKFVAVLQRWRGWELGDIQGAKIVELVFGKRKPAGNGRPKSAKRREGMGARVVIGEVKVVVDPGPSQHELAVAGIVVVGTKGMAEQVKRLTGGVARDMIVPAEMIVEVCVEEARCGIRWEVLDLVEAVMERVADADIDGPKSIEDGKSGDVEKEMAGEETPKIMQSLFGGAHVLFTLGYGELILDTVNLTSTSQVHKLAASAVVSQKPGHTLEASAGLIGSLMLRADQVNSDLRFGSILLGGSAIDAPNVYVHFDEHSLAETTFHMWKIGALCEQASFRLEEQILGILEAAEHVIEDEIAQVYQLLQKFSPPTNTTTQKRDRKKSEKREVHMVHGTIAADRYILGAMILPSLAYELRGNGATMSVKPDSKDPKEIVIEICVDHHDHDLVSTARQGMRKSISLLRLPTIRTTLRGQNGEKERLWDLKSRVEEITLEAASVQSFLNALGKPEVVKVAETSADEIGKISVRVGEIFGADKTVKKSTKTTGPPLVYRASLDVAGFKVQAYAPSANLTLSLDFIRARATNKPHLEILPSGFPEALLEFGKISLELTRATETDAKELCGYLELHTSLSFSPKQSEEGLTITTLGVKSHSLKIDLYADTASTVVSVVGHLQDRLKELEIPKEVRNQVQRLQTSKPSTKLKIPASPTEEGARSSALFNTSMSVDLNGIKISWIVGSSPIPSLGNKYRQDLVLSVKRIHFETSTKRDSDAQLRIEEFLLQMVDGRVQPTPLRTQNSALMPQVEFNVAYRISGCERRVALQAKGQTLDVRLNSSCIVAGNAIQQSIAAASQKFRTASANWKMKPTESGKVRKNMFTTKRLASVIANADFAGAVVNFLGPDSEGAASAIPSTSGRLTADEAIGNTVLKSPGLAFKVEYIDTAIDDPSLNAEIKISASNNTLYPSVVPLILEISENVKEIMKQQPENKKQLQQTIQADAAEIVSSDTAVILGRCRLNVGFRILQQKFTLSCQPLERVAASAQFEQIYVTVNTCDEPDHGRFYASSATVKGLRAELKHIYSRDSAGEFGVDNIILSLMNSRHVTGSQGLSCILKVAPIKARVNVNQFRDYLVFREIWTPPGSLEPAAPTPGYSYDGLAQRYHEVAATKAFPSNTSVIMSEIGLTIDFGLKIGRSTLKIMNLWGTSKKSSDWEQSLALGFDEIKITSEGRLSGFANMADGSLSTSIAWDPTVNLNEPRAPRIKATIGFKNLQLKVAFESEVFMLAEVGTLGFEMMNRHQEDGDGDRLEAKVTGDKLHFFCTAVTAARSVALSAVLRNMMEEKRKQFRSSLEDIEKFMRRRTQFGSSTTSSSGAATPTAMAKLGSQQLSESSSSPTRKDSGPHGELLSLHTDVMVDLSHIFIGVFPSTLGDTRIFRVEATKATARFAREIEHEPPLNILSSSSPPPNRVHSSLEMIFEDLNVEVPSIKQNNPNQALHGDVVMENVVKAARSARGSPVLRVPRHTAVMNTWDGGREAVEVELEFGNKFQGQVTIGWDLSRIGFIKLLYGIHKSAMEKQLHGGDDPSPTLVTSKYAAAADVVLSATDEPKNGSKTPEGSESDVERKKIKGMPVVKVPQSKYIYVGRSVNVETPQLRDMGEATPPLEWLGVNMERLPQVTHQYVIVTLQEVARTVEDRYWKILGS